MATLLIANTRTEDMIGDLAAQTDLERRLAGCSATRLVWFAKDEDVVVLPWRPDDLFVDYVTRMTGTRRSSLRLVAPPPGVVGVDLLSPDRLANGAFRAELREVLADRTVQEISPIYKDPSIVALARALGCEEALAGRQFSGQGGSALVNSKAVFRAIAAGLGVPTAPGAVVTHQAEAAEHIAAELSEGFPVMLKQEHQAGGAGNEVLSPVEGITPVGARHAVVIKGRPAVDDYLTRRWDWLTGGRGHRLVIERYYPDSVPFYVEFLAGEAASELLGHGQMLMTPILEGVVSPGPDLPPEQLPELVDHGRRLCEAFRLLGYRGVLTPDAFLTPSGQLLFSETNGRISGATHMHTAISDCLGGPGQLSDRVLLERGFWEVPSFGLALDLLDSSGLGLNQATRTGVALVCDMVPANGTVRHCIVAENLDAAYEQERRLKELSASVAGANS